MSIDISVEHRVALVWDRVAGILMQQDLRPDAAMGVPDEVETYPQDWLAQLVEPFKRVRGTSTAAPARLSEAMD